LGQPVDLAGADRLGLRGGGRHRPRAAAAHQALPEGRSGDKPVPPCPNVL